MILMEMYDALLVSGSFVCNSYGTLGTHPRHEMRFSLRGPHSDRMMGLWVVVRNMGTRAFEVLRSIEVVRFLMVFGDHMSIVSTM